jgi:hypothetical protein
VKNPLPTTRDLEKLPLRAVVAYAARTARRLSSGLRGIVADDILDNALGLIERVYTTSQIDQVDWASLYRGVERVAGAYAEAPADTKSPDKFSIVFCLGHAAGAAVDAILATEYRNDSARWMKEAAAEAVRTVACIRSLECEAAEIAKEAARQDYDTLIKEYGQHEEVILGEPVNWSKVG